MNTLSGSGIHRWEAYEEKKRLTKWGRLPCTPLITPYDKGLIHTNLHRNGTYSTGLTPRDYVRRPCQYGKTIPDIRNRSEYRFSNIPGILPTDPFSLR